MVLRVLLTFALPFVLGFLVRGWVDRALARRDARLRRAIEADSRTPLLAAASDDELLDELAKRDLHSSKGP